MSRLTVALVAAIFLSMSACPAAEPDSDAGTEVNLTKAPHDSGDVVSGLKGESKDVAPEHPDKPDTGGIEAKDDDVPAEDEPPLCCSVEDLISLQQTGTDDAVIIEKIYAGKGPVLPILRDIGVSQAVIDRWLEPPPAPKPDGPAPLNITMAYDAGDNSYRLTNRGSRDLTEVVITINRKYVYRLPVPLNSGKGDTVQLASHKDRDGKRLAPPVPPPGYHYTPIDHISVRARQGSWSKRR